MRDLFTRKWGSKVERERRRRIMLSAWAYAYEFEADSLVSDEEFDRESYLVDPSINTGRPDLDHFFRTEFDPCTGQWIYKHPELEKVKAFYWRLKSYEQPGRSKKIHRKLQQAHHAG